MDELNKISLEANENEAALLPCVELKLNNFEQQRKNITLHDTGNKISSITNKLTSEPNFEEEFEQVFKHKELQQKKQELLKSLSDEYLGNYPEYESRLNVLRELNYIDHEDRGEILAQNITSS